MIELEYKFTNDILFKMLFVKHPSLLKKLVATLLKIKLDSITAFEITNPEIPPEFYGDKFCRLDINMLVDGQRVDLEVQVNNEGDYPERSLYYWAREYSTALGEGGTYSDLPRTIIISILAFKLFDCMEYHSEYQPLEVTRHTPLSDRMALHYFELSKLPENVTGNNIRELWLSLLRSKTEEDLARLEALEVSDVKQAIEAYRHITVTPEFREAERLRAKARHDEAQALHHARSEGRHDEKYDIARIMIAGKEPLEKITKYTGLTREEVEGLQGQK